MSVDSSSAFTNGYNKWTTNSDDAELADVIRIDGSLMEGVTTVYFSTFII